MFPICSFRNWIGSLELSNSTEADEKEGYFILVGFCPERPEETESSRSEKRQGKLHFPYYF
jgi:hypothetical protein